MKKRHEQKLIVLSLALLLLFSVPMVLLLDGDSAVFGIPSFYFGIFIIWFLAILISYIVLNRHYE